MTRTIVFDMGNVLVRFSHARMCEQIGRLCDSTGGEVAVVLFESGLQWDFERGRCDEEEFRRRFEAAIGRAVPPGDLRHAAADIFEPVEGMREVVYGLKASGLRLVLLSNTSVTHYEFIRSRWDLLDPFDELVMSYRVGAIKPEPAIYAAALAAVRCRPEEAFYTDDIPAYIEAGRSHGLDAEVFTTAKRLREHLAARGVEVGA